METRINYILLLVIIIVGVAAGNIISEWISSRSINKQAAAQIVEKAKPSSEIKQELSSQTDETVKEIEPEKINEPRETIKLSPDGHKQSETTDIPADSEELITQRKLDENGLRLSKKCNEWTIVHKDMNTASSERGMNKHCSQYYDYISFGALPESN